METFEAAHDPLNAAATSAATDTFTCLSRLPPRFCRACSDAFLVIIFLPFHNQYVYYNIALYVINVNNNFTIASYIALYIVLLIFAML